MQFEQETKAVTEVLDKRMPLTSSDLQILRENAVAAANLSSRSDWFVLRIQIELIDAIRSLDGTSTTLMRVAIGIGVVGVLVSAAQIIAAILLRN